jgi:hypothetical protein
MKVIIIMCKWNNNINNNVSNNNNNNNNIRRIMKIMVMKIIMA